MLKVSFKSNRKENILNWLISELLSSPRWQPTKEVMKVSENLGHEEYLLTLLTCAYHTTPQREKGEREREEGEGEKKGKREGEGEREREGERLHTHVVCMCVCVCVCVWQCVI